MLIQKSQIKKELPDWKVGETEISRTFEFKDFTEAIEFVNKVSSLAKEANHHPDIDIRYNKVMLVLSTHSEGGVTDKDVALAKKIIKTLQSREKIS